MSGTTSATSTTFNFTLSAKAKSKGADKYVCDSKPEFNIYIPQDISRTDSKEPKSSVKITIE
jgi:hypothetical protein